MPGSHRRPDCREAGWLGGFLLPPGAFFPDNQSINHSINRLEVVWM
jgi:hypothetical protein